MSSINCLIITNRMDQEQNLEKSSKLLISMIRRECTSKNSNNSMKLLKMIELSYISKIIRKKMKCLPWITGTCLPEILTKECPSKNSKRAGDSLETKHQRQKLKSISNMQIQMEVAYFQKMSSWHCLVM